MKALRTYFRQARLWALTPANWCVLMLTIGALIAQTIVIAITIYITSN